MEMTCEVGETHDMNVADSESTDPDPRFYRLVIGYWMLQLREELGLEQGEVARALDLGPSILSDYERLRSTPSVAIAERIFRHYGVDEERLEMLKAFAREGRRRSKSKPRDPVIPGWFELYKMLERHASDLSLFALSTIPGLFQTRRYTESVLRAGVYHDAADLNPLVEIRLERQKILDDPTVHISAVIKESALHALVGGPEVMTEQLDHLIDLAERPNLTIQVLPNDVGAHPSMGSEFAVLKFTGAGIAVAYTETLTDGLYEKTPAGVALYDRAYGQLRTNALGKEPSVRLMQQIRNSYQQ
jgi:transcriptional regulator with XRE-family HTH domain